MVKVRSILSGYQGGFARDILMGKMVCVSGIVWRSWV